MSIAYGKAIVGNLGSAERIDYTAVGDIVNVSAHLQGMAKGKNEILINKNVYDMIKDSIDCEFYRDIILKSRTKKCETYKILN